ncbi:MAG: YCF48-related protein [Cyclobacteriaceae bacterium]
MKNWACFIFVLFIACTKQAGETVIQPDWISVSFDKYPGPTSIRALEVTDRDHIYYAGANGAFGYSENGGSTWHHDSIEVQGVYPEFRAISVTSEAVFLLSVGSPAYLLRSTDMGMSWELVYSEEGESVFYDAMKFNDNDHGIAMGDPVGDCISIIRSNDGGKSWKKVECDALPAVEEG